MIQRIATIRNSAGIHCRPSAVIIKTVSGYAGKVEVSAGAGDVDLRSMLALVSLGLERGARVTVRVTGPDEESFCDELVELFERHFDFPPLGGDERARVASEMLADL